MEWNGMERNGIGNRIDAAEERQEESSRVQITRTMQNSHSARLDSTRR